MISAITILNYVLFTVLPALVLYIWKDYTKRISVLEKRLREIEQNSHVITKDDIREIIQEEFTKFELKLINQGRLNPLK